MNVENAIVVDILTLYKMINVRLLVVKNNKKQTQVYLVKIKIAFIFEYTTMIDKHIYIYVCIDL